MKNTPLTICDVTIQPGEKVTLAFPTPEFYTCAPMHISMHVIHGKTKGPVLLIAAAMHGDEVNGIEIIQRLLRLKSLENLSGTLIAIPVVNVYGLIARSRNLPDGRDLEGSFPGSEKGAYASRLAYFFNKNVLQLADYCIDLHTAEIHINKLPQVFTDLENEKANQLAKAFNAPVINDTKDPRALLFLMKNSEKSIPTLLYEAGEALHIDEDAIKIGIKGIINVMKELKMLKHRLKVKPKILATIKKSSWIYSPGSGICNFKKKLGSYVYEGDLIAKIVDPFGTKQTFEIKASFSGIIIGMQDLPLIIEGEPIVQVALYSKPKDISKELTSWQETDEPEK